MAVTRNARIRLIPACAGKTTCARVIVSVMGAHPRVCGENKQNQTKTLKMTGSSPRVRGKRRDRHRRAPGPRLIPACAGKTAERQPSYPEPRAHPRVCGENGCSLWLAEALPGSSPRVRGKPGLGTALASNIGLIPACAGKTTWRASRGLGGWAHPRVCGENAVRFRRSEIERGSSPRVRGKRLNLLDLRGVSRLIPACAGKTYKDGIGEGGRRAHPRVCGENLVTKQPRISANGSSPRVRGKRPFDFKSCISLGLIPACAGKTPRPR